MRWTVLPTLLMGITIMAGGLTMPTPVRHAVERLERSFGYNGRSPAIVVDPAVQTLYLVKGDTLLASYPVSTAKAGLGNREGSYQTPTGVHRICARIGKGAPVGTIFRARRNTGKIARIYTDPVDVPEDYVTTRILRLAGMEPGVNKGPGIDSYDRYIYIHGTPEEGLIGTPASHGCIRMRNADVVDLFDRVRKDTLVIILDRRVPSTKTETGEKDRSQPR